MRLARPRASMTMSCRDAVPTTITSARCTSGRPIAAERRVVEVVAIVGLSSRCHRVPAEREEPSGLSDGQRAPEDRIQQPERRRRRADGETERENRCAGLRCDASSAAATRRRYRRTPRGATASRADRASRPSPATRRQHAARGARASARLRRSRVLRGQLHMKPQLFLEIAIAPAAAERARQAMHPFAKRAHAISSPYCSRSAVSGGSVAARSGRQLARAPWPSHRAGHTPGRSPRSRVAADRRRVLVPTRPRRTTRSIR